MSWRRLCREVGISALVLASVGVVPVATQAPPRIVSLVPGASQLLVELGAGHRPVGRSLNDQTSALTGVPGVGRVLELDLDSLERHLGSWLGG